MELCTLIRCKSKMTSHSKMLLCLVEVQEFLLHCICQPHQRFLVLTMYVKRVDRCTWMECAYFPCLFENLDSAMVFMYLCCRYKSVSKFLLSYLPCAELLLQNNMQLIVEKWSMNRGKYYFCLYFIKDTPYQKVQKLKILRYVCGYLYLWLDGELNYLPPHWKWNCAQCPYHLTALCQCLHSWIACRSSCTCWNGKRLCKVHQGYERSFEGDRLWTGRHERWQQLEAIIVHYNLFSENLEPELDLNERQFMWWDWSREAQDDWTDSSHHWVAIQLGKYWDLNEAQYETHGWTVLRWRYKLMDIVRYVIINPN